MKVRPTGHWIALLSIIIGLIFIGGPFYMALDNVSTERDSKIKNLEPNAVSGSGRAAEYLEGIMSPNNVFYAGDSKEEFHIRITEDYGGEAYEGVNKGNDQFNNDDLFEATVSIREFRDVNGKAISGADGNPFSGFASGYGSAYNGPDGDGFSISNNQNWYATDGFDDFQLNIKSTVTPGEYTLYVIVHYSIRIEYNGAKLEYNLSARTEDLYIPIEVKSGLGVAHEKKVAVYDTPNGNLYAGAILQKIGVTGISSQVGDVGGIGGTLSYSGNEISIPTIYTTASLGELDGGATATLYWRINVKDDAAPGKYELKLSLSYTRNWDDGDNSNDIRVTENSIILKMDIDFTPLLSPPDSKELTSHLSQIDQEDDPELSFEVIFTNGGNVDLIQIEVSLDLTAADYFYTSDFYYDEDNHAVKKDLGTEKEIESMEVGTTESVTFKVRVRDTIPPGRYIIPILYDAKYFDTGVFGGSSIDIDTDENEFHNIMTARGEKEPDDKSYIYILVEDSILDMEANTPNRLQPGMVEANLAVNLQNVDGYDLTKLKISIPSSEDLPIFPIGGSKVFEYHLVDTLGSGWTTTQTYVVNVKEGDRWIGFHDIPVTVICRNELEENVTITIPCELEIVPVPPDIVVAMVETPLIEEEENFDLKVTLMNIGGSKASNVTALLLDNNNWFESGGAAVFKSGKFDLEPSGTHTVTFKMNADKVDLNSIHNSVQNLSVRLEYKDSKGNQIRFSQSAPLDVQLKTEDESNVEAATMRDWVYLILGILALIVVVVFPFIYFRYRYKANKKEKKFTKKLEERGLEDESISKPKKSRKDKKKSQKEDDVRHPLGVPTQQPWQAPAPVRDQHPQQWGAPSHQKTPPHPVQSGPRPPVLQHSGQVPRAPNVAQGPQYNQPLLPEHYP